MAQHYSNPERANDAHALPDVETFYHTPQAGDDIDLSNGEYSLPSGWYWQSCFPGCLPDSDPNGPFATEAEALEDAREGVTDDDLPAEVKRKD